MLMMTQCTTGMCGAALPNEEFEAFRDSQSTNAVTFDSSIRTFGDVRLALFRWFSVNSQTNKQNHENWWIQIREKFSALDHNLEVIFYGFNRSYNSFSTGSKIRHFIKNRTDFVTPFLDPQEPFILDYYYLFVAQLQKMMQQNRTTRIPGIHFQFFPSFPSPILKSLLSSGPWSPYLMGQVGRWLY